MENAARPRYIRRMRTWLLALALLGCQNPSKLDAIAQAPCDELWGLAPAGTEVGIVVSPRALQLGLDALAAAHALVKLPDFAPVAPALDAIDAALFGAPGAAPDAAGMTAARGFALFVAHDGVLGVMPVADRDKFVAARHGTRGAGADDADDIGGKPCKPIAGVYACASKPELFDKLGTGDLRGKVALAGARGDVELFAPQLELFGGKGDLAIAGALAPGSIDVRGKWTGTVTGEPLGKLAGVAAPRVDSAAASGFAAGNLSALLADMPPFPLAGGVTMDKFVHALAGPIAVTVPAGSMDVQVHLPLGDVATVQTVVGEHCAELGQIFDLAPDQPKDACRLRLESSSAFGFALDAWVDAAAKKLRLGSRAQPATGKPGAVTALGKELAAGGWTAVLWGRGTILDRTGMTATAVVPPADSAAVIHATALIDELGAGFTVDASGVAFRGAVRTIWDNPAGLAMQIAQISGVDIASGASTDKAKALAATAPTSPFAADVAAGQGGLVLPDAVIGLAGGVVVMEAEKLLGLGTLGELGAGGDDDGPPAQPDPAP